jgi:TP901 family phage tail tape measure protein
MGVRSELRAEISANSSGFSAAMGGLPGMARTAFGAVGAAIAAVTGGLGLSKLVGKLSDAETGLAKVNTIARLSSSELATLEAAAAEVGTEIGILTEDRLEAMYQALSAGVPSDQLIQFLRTVGQAAIGGQVDLTTAVDGISSALNAYGMEASRAQEVSDAFFLAVRLGKTTFGELAESIGQVAPLASSMGISLDEVLAGITSLTKQGIATSQAVTSIRSAMVALQKPTQSMKTVLAALNSEVAGFVNLPFVTRLQLIREKAQALGLPLSEVFGRVEALNGVVAVTGTKFAAAASDMDAFGLKAGETAGAYDEMSQTFGVALDRLQAASERALQEAGEGVLPVFTEAIGDLIAEIQRLRENGDLEAFAKGTVDTFKAILEGARSTVGALKEVYDAYQALGRFGGSAGDAVAETLAGKPTQLTADQEKAWNDFVNSGGRGEMQLPLPAAPDASQDVMDAVDKLINDPQLSTSIGDILPQQTAEVAEAIGEALSTSKPFSAAEVLAAEAKRTADEKSTREKQAQSVVALQTRSMTAIQEADSRRQVSLRERLDQTVDSLLSRETFSEVWSGKGLTTQSQRTISNLIDRFGKDQVRESLLRARDAGGLDAAKAANRAPAQPPEVMALMQDVAKIREKVDKMAGLTGN